VTIDHVTDRPRRIAILGSTGSIGRQAIDVVLAHPHRFEVVSLVAGSNRALLDKQAAELGVTRAATGSAAAVEAAGAEDVDVVLNAIVGVAGLRASVAALEAGKTLALANKESLVAGGDACRAAADRGGGHLVPVDSEHASLAQCLEGRDRDAIRRIVLTASGGPFRTRVDLAGVTKEDALRHPTWAMGPKITIDCATLMNKGLEVIEAHHLFGFAYDDIDVIVHPQSVVHGIVELRDGSMIMHAAPTDMRIPIQWSLAAPERLGSAWDALDLVKVSQLEFEPLDRERWIAVGLAYEAGRKGGSYPAALNAANEVAVGAFLDDRIAFTDIPAVTADVLAGHEPADVSTVEGVLAADADARARAEELLERRAR
jgi:1-deoxy-D-xylulose-5-phosphate reductoisomerase